MVCPNSDIEFKFNVTEVEGCPQFHSPVEPEKYIKSPIIPLLNSIMIIICGYMNLLWK